MATPEATAEIIHIFKKMEYGPVPINLNAAKDWLKNHNLGPFIHGKCKAEGTSYFEALDVLTKEFLARVGKGTHTEVEEALTSCQTAADSWSKLSGHERARHLYSLARHLQKHAALLAQMETLSRGVLHRDPKEFDIPGAIRCFYYYAGWAQLSDTSEFREWTALGVAAMITSSVSPLFLTALTIAPALAAGNTICLGAVQHAPFSSLLVAQMAVEAGLPPGVVNVLPCDKEAATKLVTHDLVSKVIFMGSNKIGRLLREKTAGFEKSLTLLLTGGKSAMIVFDSADVDSAVDAVVDAAWFSQGQVPWTIGKLFVQESLWDTFIKRLCKRIDKLVIGSALDSMTDVRLSYDINTSKKIAALVDKAKNSGLKVYQKEVPHELSEHYFPPTLIIGGCVEGNCVLEDDEPLPVVTILPFRTAKEVISLANNSRYGLCVSVWTEILALAIDVANRLEFGTVWVNSNGVHDAAVPFQGWKQSGLGVLGAKEGLLEFLQPHTSAGTADNSVISSSPQITKILQKDTAEAPEVDITYKLYYGGAQKRPDSNSSYAVKDSDGHVFAFVADGNGKDVRNAVEAAVKAQDAWSKISSHGRAQILYFAAEKLQLRKEDFIKHLTKLYGEKAREVAKQEIETCIKLLFHWASCCDKRQFPRGEVEPASGMMVHVTHRPQGVIAAVIITDETASNPQALLNFVALIMPALCYGNSVVVIPDSTYPTPALLFCEVLATCDCPNGVVNVITGKSETLMMTLASHQEIASFWAPGVKGDTAKCIELASKENFKHCWVKKPSLDSIHQWSENTALLEMQATKCKAIWLPSGEIFAN